MAAPRPDTRDDAPATTPKSGWKRFGWFALIYGASVIGFVSFVYAFRALIPR